MFLPCSTFCTVLLYLLYYLSDRLMMHCWNALHVFSWAIPFVLSVRQACGAGLKCLACVFLRNTFRTVFCHAIPFALSVRLACCAGLKCLACVLPCNTFSTVCQAYDARLKCLVHVFCRAIPFALSVGQAYDAGNTFCTIGWTGLRSRVEMPFACVLPCNTFCTVCWTGLWGRAAWERCLRLRLQLWCFRPPRSWGLHLWGRNGTYCPAIFAHSTVSTGVSENQLMRADVKERERAQV